jgi:hypothetical protein
VTKSKRSAADATTVSPSDGFDELVPDRQMRKELGDPSEMTITRWEADASLDFPMRVTIRGRNFRVRRELEAFKARMIANAISAQRSKRKDRAHA